MRILLLRHAVTGETGKVLTGRLPGVSLSEAGVTMAEELGATLGDSKLAAVYTSPIERCKETATIVAKQHGLRVRTRSGFVEADYGWAGMAPPIPEALQLYIHMMEGLDLKWAVGLVGPLQSNGAREVLAPPPPGDD